MEKIIVAKHLGPSKRGGWYKKEVFKFISLDQLGLQWNPVFSILFSILNIGMGACQ